MAGRNSDAERNWWLNSPATVAPFMYARKGGHPKYSNNSSFQLVTPYLCHFLSSLNCMTDSGRRYVKFPRQIHRRHSHACSKKDFVYNMFIDLEACKP